MKQDIYKNNIPFFFFIFVTAKLLFSSLTFYSLFQLFILYSNFLFSIPTFILYSYFLFSIPTFILYSSFLFSIQTFLFSIIPKTKS